MGKYTKKIEKLQKQEEVIKQMLKGFADNYDEIQTAIKQIQIKDVDSFLDYVKNAENANKILNEKNYANAQYVKTKYFLNYYQLLDQYPNNEKAKALIKFINWIEVNPEKIQPYHQIQLTTLKLYGKKLLKSQLKLVYLNQIVLPKKLKEQKQTWALKNKIKRVEKDIKDIEAKILSLKESFADKFHAKFVAKLEKAKKNFDLQHNEEVYHQNQLKAKQKAKDVIANANEKKQLAKDELTKVTIELKNQLSNQVIDKFQFNERYTQALDQYDQIIAEVKLTKKNAKNFYRNYSDFSSLENVIDLKNVCKYYNNGYLAIKVLQDVNLQIEKGEFVVILGPSGSGKTTLLNIISGMDNATYGDVFIAGENLIDYKQNQLTAFRKNNIGYVFQQYCLLPNLTVKENIQIGQNLQPNKSLHIDIDTILDTIGMSLQKNKYPNELSGGQQQRVSIARSIAKNPNILFGDEPTGAIDEEMSKEIMKLLVKINQEYKTTIIIVTHNPVLAQLATTVVHVNNGTIQNITHQRPKTVDELNWNKGL